MNVLTCIWSVVLNIYCIIVYDMYKSSNISIFSYCINSDM